MNVCMDARMYVNTTGHEYAFSTPWMAELASAVNDCTNFASVTCEWQLTCGHTLHPATQDVLLGAVTKIE